ncbi:CENP-S associating Centromere protein X [Teratosphaeria destructans]|uniref:CENP-S associating Centromere protein X n=1 Tax=Teratosphaeria destructans TaxID=418781 RepID=A0A9W7SWF2_9PEZI|nr:CENP-S associating Centromere protein X [Teratosphaeria destructans]
MPPRKEPKETVIYPASKRKAPAFKPQIPDKVRRIATTGSESSAPRSLEKPVSSTEKRPSRARNVEHDEEISDGPATAGSTHQNHAPTTSSEDDSDDEELSKDPFANPKKAPPTRKKPKSTGKTALRESRHASDATAVTSSPPPLPSYSDQMPQVPQALLVRILHEHFKDRATKIDKRAIVVLQKYLEVFIREAIARARLAKAEREGIDADDRKWLDVDDLEKVAGHMLLEFG